MLKNNSLIYIAAMLMVMTNINVFATTSASKATTTPATKTPVSTTAASTTSNTNSNKKPYNEDNKNITINAKNTTFTITLKSNPTTGYSWFLREYDVNLIKPVSHKFVQPDSKLMGAPGYETFVFRAKPEAFIVPTQTTVRLSYSRPFEGSDGAKQIVFYVSST